jgi:hypothetical protein
MELADVVAGDVIVFSGEAPIHRFVQRHTGSPWVQAGIVVELPDHRDPFLLESTSRPVCSDIENGTLLPGVRTTPLRSRIESAEGAAAVRKLIPPLAHDLKRKLAFFRKSVVGLPFNFSRRSIRATLRRAHTDFEQTSFSCSSLVATAYQAIGIMYLPPLGPYPSNVWPSDFCYEQRLGLTKIYTFGPLCVI